MFNLELYWSVANGEFEPFHARQHSNMLIISPNCCIEGVLPFAFAFALGEYTAGGLLEDLEYFSYRRQAGICPFLQSTKQGGRCYWAMGFHVKTVLVIF